MDAEKESVLAYARDAKVPNTKRAYQSDWDAFAAFCAAQTHVSLPAPADVHRPPCWTSIWLSI
jgi:hypothetical protein